MAEITISDAISIGNNKLKLITNNYINETFWLLSACLKRDKSILLLNQNNIINSQELNSFINFIDRRLNNEPLQLILKSVSFYKYEFISQKNVFITRPETELCIDILKQYNKTFESVLEVGTGLGCISITLSLEKLSHNIDAIDISANAINAANLNAKKLKCNNIRFLNQNIFTMKHDKRYNLIISNPPYISISEVKNLDHDVLLYDPLSSLTDFDDGLNFYRYFSNIGHKILAHDGLMLFEFGGHHQIELLKNIFESKNYQISFFNDLNNIPRFLLAKICN